MITISITVDASLLEAIDEAARDSKLTRSEVCRIALRKWLRSERVAALVREEQKAYRAQPVSPDELDDLVAGQRLHTVDEDEL